MYKAIFASLLCAASVWGATVKPAQAIEARAKIPYGSGIASQIPGIVRLNVTVDRNGAVTKAKYLTGRADLFQAAMRSVRTIQFEAAMIDGQPVASTVEVVMKFNFDSRQ